MNFVGDSIVSQRPKVGWTCLLNACDFSVRFYCFYGRGNCIKEEILGKIKQLSTAIYPVLQH